MDGGREFNKWILSLFQLSSSDCQQKFGCSKTAGSVSWSYRIVCSLMFSLRVKKSMHWYKDEELKHMDTVVPREPRVTRWSVCRNLHWKERTFHRVEHFGTSLLLAVSDPRLRCNSVGTSQSHPKSSMKSGEVDVPSRTPELYYRQYQRGKE